MGINLDSPIVCALIEFTIYAGFMIYRARPQLRAPKKARLHRRV